MIYMLWRECIPEKFYKHICKKENFKYLNGRDAIQSGVLEIVGRFIDQHKDLKFKTMRENEKNEEKKMSATIL